MSKKISAVLMSVAIVAALLGGASAGSCAEAYDNTYPFSFLEGTWTMRDGSGTVLTADGSGTMTLKEGSVRISALSPNAGDTGGTAAIRVRSDWKLSSGGNSTTSSVSYQESGVFTNTDNDEYTLTYAFGTVSGKVIVTLTGAMRATVSQTERDTSPTDSYTIALSYDLTRTNDDDDDEEEDSGGGCSAGWPVLALLAGVPLIWKRRQRP